MSRMVVLLLVVSSKLRVCWKQFMTCCEPQLFSVLFFFFFFLRKVPRVVYYLVFVCLLQVYDLL